MKCVAIIQARTGSSRLPGKVLRDLAGRPVLAQQIHRLRQCAEIDEVVIATTASAVDDPVADLARREDVGWFRGDEHDVLSRIVGAARQSGAELVVRLTGDCPMLDPGVTDTVIRDLRDHATECDYVSNVGKTGKWTDGASTVPLERSFPRGLDVEALFMDTLLRIDRLAVSQPAREHVTVVLRSERPELFLTRLVRDNVDNSDLRWTVDTEADLDLLRTLFRDLGLGEQSVSYRTIVEYVRARPELTHANSDEKTFTG